MGIDELLQTATPRVAAQWALDCVEHVLPLFERDNSDDKKPHHAIMAARQYLAGSGTYEELAATREAAWVAWGAWKGEPGGFTARISWAAYEASVAAESARGASDNEWNSDVVWNVGWATWSCARAVHESMTTAESTERQWQLAHLLEMLQE